MNNLRKYVFERMLCGKPLDLTKCEFTVENIQCLIDCGVLRQFATQPRRIEDLGLIIVQYPLLVTYDDKKPGMHVDGHILRLKRIKSS